MSRLRLNWLLSGLFESWLGYFFFFCSRLGSTNTQQLTLFRPIKLTLTKQACDFVLVGLTCRPTIDIATIWLVASPGRIFSSGRCAMSMSTFCQSYLSENVPRSKSWSLAIVSNCSMSSFSKSFRASPNHPNFVKLKSSGRLGLKCRSGLPSPTVTPYFYFLPGLLQKSPPCSTPPPRCFQAQAQFRLH